MAWAPTAIGGGIWAGGGVASDGTNAFIATGNTFNTGGTWGGGEAVIRFQPGPIFTGQSSDYWAPTNWFQLDIGNRDFCSGPLLVDVPGATPSSLIVVLGKDGNAYLLDRGNLGGITAPVTSLQVTDGVDHSGSGNLSNEPGQLCRFPRQQHHALCFSDYCNQSACYRQCVERAPEWSLLAFRYL